MPSLKMPAALRWLLVICFLLLFIMTAYRVFLVVIFSNASTSKISVLINGIMYDAGVVALVGIVFMGIFNFKRLHPYRSKKGLKFFLWYFSIILFLLLLIYALDLVSIKTFGQRLTGTKLWSLFGGNPRRDNFIKNVPILPLATGVIVTLWVWWMLIDWLHQRLGLFDRANEKMHRLLWHGITIACFTGILFYSSIKTNHYDIPEEVRIGQSRETALRMNPILGLILL